MHLRAVTRGRLQHLVVGGGQQPPEARLYGCRVRRAPYEKNGKTYVVLGVQDALGDLDVLHRVDDFVRRQHPGSYSPILLETGAVIAKLTSATKYENEDGDPAAPWHVRQDAAVDVVLRPGAFGSFGYCWLVHRLKPHALKI